MASKFVVPDREQSFFEMVSYREVLGDDHLVWTIIEVVEQLDLSVLYARYVPDPSAGGRPAFDPAMMVTLLFFGYCEGKNTSRKLEEACRRDWAYRAICGGSEPDHATIARFRQGMDDVLKSLFTQVLTVCAEAGLLEVGLVALDGTKMGSAASKEANRTAETLTQMEVEARRLLDQAAEADRCDRDDSGESTSRPSSVKRREAERVRRVERIRHAQQRVAEAVTNQEAEEIKRGKPKRPVGNVTDPESRLQKTRNGFIQGYNAQAIVTGDQIVIAAEVIAETTDVAMLEPMLTAAVENLEAAGVVDPVGVGVADARYWSQANAEAGDALGIDLLIATTKSHRVGAPDDDKVARDRDRLGVITRIDTGEISIAEGARRLELSHSYVSKLAARYRDHGSLASEATVARRQMEHKLAEPTNRDRYRQRGWLVEGSFAHIKTHRNSGRFLRRGLTACNAEWTLINLAGNLLKLHRRPKPTPKPGPESQPEPQQSRNTPRSARCTRPGSHLAAVTPYRHHGR